MDLTTLKQRMQAEITARAASLVDASRQIHAHPELNYDEHFAHDLLTAMLSAEGLTPAADAMRRELEKRFQGAMEQLNDLDREILTMRHYEQLSNQEVADRKSVV